jgi:hypothetical protein
MDFTISLCVDLYSHTELFGGSCGSQKPNFVINRLIELLAAPKVLVHSLAKWIRSNEVVTVVIYLFDNEGMVTLGVSLAVVVILLSARFALSEIVNHTVALFTIGDLKDLLRTVLFKI